MPEGSPFGPGIKAAVAYLHGCQMVGFKRLTELCEGLFGLTLSQGAISNILLRAGQPFGAAAQQIAATVRSSEVIASDETSARVKGKTHWQWTFGCTTAVYHVIAPTRGKCVPTDFLAGARPKVWLSDRLPAQCTHADAHQFCLAHLIRDAQYAIDHGDTMFAPQFKAFLKDACTVGRRRPDTTNNESERALRPSVIFQSNERIPLGMGRQGLRRPLLRCRNRPPRRPHRTRRHPRRFRSPRGRPNRSLISSMGVGNYLSPAIADPSRPSSESGIAWFIRLNGALILHAISMESTRFHATRMTWLHLLRVRLSAICRQGGPSGAERVEANLLPLRLPR
jgi:Transposase IS66 family